ncbi:transcription factor GTE4-like [Lotus japonicus]|uniref:transcription factor GTE4-like n=1 Tax=Lotus japonicus TaxID=34305 RepID=UPI00258AE604|nr:transcription factor GTE4-like [Lotus japonicus]XP_057450748.1 transcription factor GTE4-like [Lotus japonicus]
MASEPTVGGEDGAKKKQRFNESKVYKRKTFKGPKKNPNFGHTATDNTSTSTVTKDVHGIGNSSTVRNSCVDEGKSNSDNVSAKQPVQVVVLEDGNSAQQQVSSGLEDGKSSQLQVEDGNLAQPHEGSRLEDGSTSQPQLEDRNLAQPHGGSGPEVGNSAQRQVSDGNSAQQQVSPRLEGGNLAEPLQGSRLEDGSTPQPQLEDRNLAQPHGSSGSEDGNSAQQPVSPRLEDGNSAQQQVNSRPEDGNSSQVSSRLEDGNLAQQLHVDSTLEDKNSPQPQMNATLEDEHSPQLEVNSQLEDRRSPQPQENSRLEDVNSSQMQVNLRLEDGSLPQPPVNSRLQDESMAQPLVSDDSRSHQLDEPSSLNVQQEHDGPSSPSHRQEVVPITRDLPSMNGAVEPLLEDRIKINLASKSRQEMQELRWKLESELGVVRSLVKRIEVKQGQVSGGGNLNVFMGGGIESGGGAKRAHSEVASAGVPRQITRPLHHLSLPLLENNQGVSENLEKEKRTPKANQFYHNSEFLLAKDKFPPAESNKKSKLHWKKQGGGEFGHGLRMGSKFFKSCSSLLEKLMKHKFGWVFNTPVDVEGLGLHDYFTIITHPMDLGTVKTRLNKNWYKSPKEFAEDVRLTFRNAMTYNPEGQDVHVMAEQLSKIFEDRWAIIESDYNREMRYGVSYGVAPPAPSPLSRKVPAFPPPPLDMRRILDRSESLIRTPKTMSITPSSRTPAPKKPKAKDPHKRDMTYEEKQKLSTNLQSLPPEKLDAIVQIIKRRSLALSQHDDEIEVDIDSVDAETLWELDRFVTNYKKSLSKNKRKAELARARAEALQNAIDKNQAQAVVEIPRDSQTDERNAPPVLPGQGGIEANNQSRSSSSSSSSSDSGSSSSDSDSDSSSASGSDAESQGT